MSARLPKALWATYVEYLRDNKFDSAECHLYKNDVAIDSSVSQSTLDDFEECDFSGYGSFTVSGGGLSFNEAYYTPGEQSITLTTDSIQANHNGGGTANTVYGYWIEKTGALLFAEKFSDGPYSMGSLNDSLTVKPTLKFKYPGA